MMQATNMLSRTFALCILLMICVLLARNSATAEFVAVHHQEGVSRGFPVIRSLDGKILATGDTIQVADGNKVTSEMVFHFTNGSLYDEKTVFHRDSTSDCRG
jgi:hypothetical protein